MAVAALGVQSVRVAVLGNRLEDERAARLEAELELTNVEARSDTTRLVYQDSLRSVRERLVLQERDVPGDPGTVAHTTVTGTVASVVDTSTTVATAGADTTTLVARFDEYKEPVRLEAEVRVTPVDRQAELTWSVALDPIELAIDIRCEDIAERDIRRALMSVTGPPWFVADIQSTQHPDVCNSQVFMTPSSGVSDWWLIPVGAAAGALTSLVAEQNPAVGAAIGGGIGIIGKVVF